MMSQSMVLVLLLVAFTVSAHPFSSCATGAEPFTIKSLDISPDPPVKGQAISVSITADLAEGAAITSGSVQLKVSYLGVQVIAQNFDVCSVIACPAKGGSTITGHKSITVPPYAPSGDFDAKMYFLDGSNVQLSCTEFKFTL